MMAFLDARYLFYDTVVTGGDSASWQGVADHLLRVLLPEGRLTGWDLGSFCGYPNFSFYFLPPFLLAALPSYLFGLPLTITLKAAICAGIFLLPVMTYLGLRAMGYRFPGPIVGAGATLLFLFNESYTMFGGNVLSTLTGEFCYMFAFSLFACFMGTLWRGVEREQGAVGNGILLGLIGLSHLFVFIPAVCLVVYLFLVRGRARYLLKVCLPAFGLMAFWILPLIAFRHPYTTPVYMIWQEFVSWRYTFFGIGLLLLLVMPRLALAALGARRAKGWGPAMVVCSALFVFTLFYLGATYAVLGQGLFDTGIELTPLSKSPLGMERALVLRPWIVPFSLGLSLISLFAGLWACRTASGCRTFCQLAGSVTLLMGIAVAAWGLYHFMVPAIPGPGLRSFFLHPGAKAAVFAALLAPAAYVLLFHRPFAERVLQAASGTQAGRFGMFLGLAFGCVVGYFAAHYLQVPDIRFLPPLLFVLLLIFFVDTLEPFLAQLGKWKKAAAGLLLTYAFAVTILFITSTADHWFRYNNLGYEHRPGYPDFLEANRFLAGPSACDPLNKPRVGYEKCNLYGVYGGDRVFESLVFFSGRQSMEGIHYASSMAARFMAFLQTAYSRDVKTPRSYVLSRLNPRALPAYFDLYNLSQLILMTDEGRQAIATSPLFEKEASFGDISIYRYLGCDGRYVDVPAVRPLLYHGKDWVEDFFRWYKTGNHLDRLLIPEAYVKDEEDRRAFPVGIASLQELPHATGEPLDRSGLQIQSRLQHLTISFTTNRVGVPHLVKVSYYPNWQVKGAKGVYPVSPHLMMVIPREKEVTLTYGRTPWDLVGTGITWATLLFLIVWALVKLLLRWTPGLQTAEPSKSPLIPLSQRGKSGHALSQSGAGRDFSSRLWDILLPETLVRLTDRLRPYLLGLLLFAAAAVVTGGAISRNEPVRIYVRGYGEWKIGMDLLQSKKPDLARPHFEKAIEVMAPLVADRARHDHQDVILCMLFTAQCREQLGEPALAERLYRIILEEYPYSRFAGEAYVKIGRLRRQERDALMKEGMDRAKRGDASGRALVQRALGLSREALCYYQSAVQEDAYSVWAHYAAGDIRQEREWARKTDEL